MTDADPSDPLTSAGRLVQVLAGLGAADLTVTGSTALGVWATPRQSRDLDLCGCVPPQAVPMILARLDGIAGGPPEDPGILRLRFADWDVDLFVVNDDPYYQMCAARAAPIDTPGGPVRVARPEDLLVHKLIKLRSDRRRLLQDLADMRALMEPRGTAIDWTYLRQWLPSVDLQFLEAVASAGDEELLRRLLGQP